MASLQQHLPFTVLKLWRMKYQFVGLRCNSTYRLRYWNAASKLKNFLYFRLLQQHLPFTVLKLKDYAEIHSKGDSRVATALTVYGIETSWKIQSLYKRNQKCCNSTYRLRYWNLLFNSAILLNEERCNSIYRLRYWNKTAPAVARHASTTELQQHLPLTVLILVNLIERREIIFSCDSISVYRIESCMLNWGYRWYSQLYNDAYY